MSCFPKCVIFITSVLLFSASLVLIYISTRTLILTAKYKKISENTHINVSAICILSAGLLLFFVTILGVIACCKRNRLLLVLFYSILMLVLFCEIGAVLLAVFYWSALESSVKQVLQLMVDTFTTDSSSHFEISKVQSTLKCCGVDDYQDWNKTAYFKENHDYPPSCCQPDSHMLHSHNLPNEPNDRPIDICRPYPKGCLPLLNEQFHRKLTLISAVSVVFTLFQILSLHGSCILMCHSQPSVTQAWTEHEYARI